MQTLQNRSQRLKIIAGKDETGEKSLCYVSNSTYILRFHLNREFTSAHGIKPYQAGFILSVFLQKMHKRTKGFFSIYCIHLLFAGKVGFLYILLVYLDRFRNVLLFHLLYRLAICSKVCFQKHQKNMFFAPRLSGNYPIDQKP